MSLGPVMIDLEGVEVNNAEQQLLRHPLVGGLIFFTRNYRNPQQLQDLVRQVRQARPEILICVDHEGGRVQRFREGFTRLPASGAMGKIYDHDKPRALELAKLAGWLMAAELRCFDIDFSFAPVLDLDFGVCEVIGDRSFGREPDKVFAMSRAYILGMMEAGMSSVGKHFPGHGAVVEDSHLDLPVDRRSLHEIMTQDVQPFHRLGTERLLDGVMPAHVVYEQVDALPAGFSPRWINQILRQQLGFDGMVFSDDLNMAAANVAGSFVDRAHAALDAGCDMVLVCNNRQGAIEVLDGLQRTISAASSERLERMRGRLAQTPEQLQHSKAWQQAVAALAAVPR